MLRLGIGIHAILQGTHVHPCYILYPASSKSEQMERFVIELAAFSIKVMLLVFCLKEFVFSLDTLSRTILLRV